MKKEKFYKELKTFQTFELKIQKIAGKIYRDFDEGKKYKFECNYDFSKVDIQYYNVEINKPFNYFELTMDDENGSMFVCYIPFEAVCNYKKWKKNINELKDVE